VRRSRLVSGTLALAEDLSAPAVPTRVSAEDYSPRFQVCFPYQGVFVWHVGRDHVVSDANQVLFVRGGETFRVSQPAPAGYAELIVTPEESLLAELLGTSERRLATHTLFAQRRRPADLRLQRVRAEHLHTLHDAACDPLMAEEGTVALLRAALLAPCWCPVPRPGTARLIARAKEYLNGHYVGRVQLTDVARHAGASPAYLTTAFRRTEGVPLHRYLTQLRLAQALVELPHASDLTALALDLGFSSHSHFAAVFRRAFACTPSAFRDAGRRRLPP
jgi:AraC-like DNA-binding protein